MPGPVAPSFACPWLEWCPPPALSGSRELRAALVHLRKHLQRLRCGKFSLRQPRPLNWITEFPLRRSKSRQPLRAVVGNCYAGDLLKRAVRLSSVTLQFRSVPVDLVEIGTIGRKIQLSLGPLLTVPSIARKVPSPGTFRDAGSWATESPLPSMRKLLR